MPIPLEKALARVENAQEKKFQMKRQIAADLRVRVCCVRGGILQDAGVDRS